MMNKLFKKIFAGIVATGAISAVFALSSVSVSAANESLYISPYTTSIKNQGSWGTCWSFATAAATEASIIKEHSSKYNVDNLDISENLIAYFAFHPTTYGSFGLSGDTFTYSGGTTGYLDCGANPRLPAAALFLNWCGPYLENDDYPYLPYSTPSIATKTFSESEYLALRNSSIAHLTDYIEVNNYSASQVTKVKNLIKLYGATTGAYYDDTKYRTNDELYYYCADSKNTNHIITIVGWNDNVSKYKFNNTPAGDGAWLIKNSWGTNFADGGYFWLSYYDKSLCALVSFDFAIEGDSDYYDNMYSYDSSIPFGYLYWTGSSVQQPPISEKDDDRMAIHMYDTPSTSSGTASTLSVMSANVFTAQKKETLKAISYYTDNLGGTDTLSVYTNLTNPKNPLSGTKVFTTTIKPTYDGYRTISLTSDVTISKGSTYAVVYTIENTGEVHMPYERGGNLYSSYLRYNPRISAGQSLYSSTGGLYWYDGADYSGIGNFALKAYTNDPEKKSIGKATVTIANAAYTGKAVSGKVTVKYGSATLKEGTDYTVTYKNNIKPGTATATIKGKGSYKGTVTKTFEIVPTKVSGLKVGSKTNTTVTLKWTKCASASGYKLQQYVSGAWKTIKSISGNGTVSFKVTGLKSSTTYKFRIAAYNPNGYWGAKSSALSVTTRPAKAANLAVSASTDKTVTLKWSAAKGAVGYKVMKYANSKWTQVAKVKTTTYKVTGLTPSKSYKFKVISYNSSDITGASSTVITLTTKPSKATNLGLDSRSDKAITLKWSAAKGATGYKVMQYVNSKWTEIAKVKTTTYKVTGLSPSKSYKFKIISYNSAGKKGAASAVATIATRPSKALGLKVSAKTSSTVTLKWNAAKGADKYKVMMYENGKWTTLGKVSETSCKLSNLKSGKTYKFKIVSYNSTTKVSAFAGNTVTVKLP